MSKYEVTYIIKVKARRFMDAPTDNEIWEKADKLRDYIEVEDRDAIDDVDIIDIKERRMDNERKNLS